MINRFSPAAGIGAAFVAQFWVASLRIGANTGWWARAEAMGQAG